MITSFLFFSKLLNTKQAKINWVEILHFLFASLISPLFIFDQPSFYNNNVSF